MNCMKQCVIISGQNENSIYQYRHRSQMTKFIHQVLDGRKKYQRNFIPKDLLQLTGTKILNEF